MPERFLPENREKMHRFQYLPFGAGPRICIGATFALQEAVIALAVLMKRYRFDVTDETPTLAGAAADYPAARADCRFGFRLAEVLPGCRFRRAPDVAGFGCGNTLLAS